MRDIPLFRPDTVDTVAARAATEGRHPFNKLNVSERIYAVAILLDQGHSNTQIAELLGTTARSVDRYRAAARQARESNP